MKKYLIGMILLLFGGVVNAQTYGVGNPPEVEWSKTDIWPLYPPVYTTALPAGMPAEKSGEDWFYDIHKKKNSGGVVDGYVMAGYVSIPELNALNYPANMYNNWNCQNGPAWSNECEDLRLVEPTDPQYNILLGEFMPLVTVTDLSGNYDPVADFKVLPIKGDAHKVIQTSDGSYLISGVTYLTSTFNIANGQVTGLTSIPYNPGYSQTDHFLDCSDGSFDKIKGYVAKLNQDLSVAWIYLYGFEQEANSSALTFMDILSMAPCGSGYMLAGYENIGGEKSFLVKVDNNGQVISAPINFSTMSRINSIERNIENGVEYFYVSGWDKLQPSPVRTRIAKLDSNGSIVWETLLSEAEDNIGNNLTISTTGDVFATTMRSFLSPESYYLPVGPTRLYKLRGSDGQVLNTYLDDDVTLLAQDFRYKVVATSDGGCAVASTAIRFPINTWTLGTLPRKYTVTMTNSCYPSHVWRWNTDTYVAKFSSSLEKIWATSFDANTATPDGTTLDLLKDCASTGDPNCPLLNWQIPNQQGLDVTRQECIFDLDEAPDGGLIIVGKNSRNIDDCYIVKLCVMGSALTLSGLTIGDMRKYSHSSIQIDNTEIDSPAKVGMEACKYILFNPGSTIKTGSVVKASIDLNACCESNNSEGQGSRVSNSAFRGENPLSDSPADGNIQTTVYPNPNSGSFSFSINTGTSEEISVELMNPLGKIIYSSNGIQSNGVYSSTIDIAGPRVAGLYVLKVHSKDKIYSKKIIVQ